MANAIVTIKLMPESPEVERQAIAEKAKTIIAEFSGENPNQFKVEEEPVAFGLVAIKITFVMDESKGLPDSLTDDLQAIEGVNSAEVIDFRRAIG